jgi:hypothetical protein
MATSYTSLIGLALPVTGELSGTWGDTVNNYISAYVDSAVAGTQTISGSQTAVTLSVTNGASLTQAGTGATGSAQYTIINCTGSPASLLTITAPASSKSYIIINNTSTSQSVKIVGAGPTTGVTVASGDKALVAWNGSDFVRVGASAGGSNTQVQYNSSGNLAGSANMTFDGTKLTVGNILDSGLTASQAVFTDASKNLVSVATTGTGSVVLATAPTLTLANATGLPLSTGVSGQLPVANGGTGSNNANGGFNALSPMTTAGDMIYGGVGGAGTRLGVGSNGNVLTVSGGAPVWAASSGGTPGGSNTQIQFNNSSAFGGSANLTWDGTNVQLGATGALRFADTDSSNYVAFKSPGVVSANVTWTLPATDGTSSQVLSTNGSGTLSWATVSATPGGSTTQVQYNNAGAFGGISGFTTDGTRVTASTTIGVGGATPSTSGSGITFPSIQSSSTNVNTLDDYEEGTWTAALTCGTSGTITVDPAYSTCKYTKVGRVVTVTGFVYISAVSSPVGTLTLTGLPFTGDSGFGNLSGVSTYIYGMSTATNLMGFNSNSSTLQFKTFSAGVTNANIASLFAATDGFLLSLSYFAAT